jgi:predicted  nucleic acid-binding Zn-ribbon protein
MTLKVGTTPHSQWRTLTPLLTRLGWADTNTTDPEAWYQKQRVSPEPGSKYILLHTRPEIAVAKAIEAGQTPTDAVEAWRAAAEHMLAFYKRNRANCVVVEVCSALREPTACVAALQKQWGLSVEGEVPHVSHPETPASVNQLLANQLIAQSDELTDLLAEVEACTLPIGEKTFISPSIQIAELFKELSEANPGQAKEQMEECARLLEAQQRLEDELESERREHLKAKKALDEAREESELSLNQLRQAQEELERHKKGEKVLEEVREENELILNQLFKVQEELERYYLEGKKKDEQLKRKDEDIAAKSKNILDSGKKLSKLTAEKKTLTTERNKLKTQVSRLNTQVNNRTEQVASLKDQVAALQANLERVCGSASWKMTAPLRSLTGSGKGKLKKEVELLRRSDFFDADWYLKKYPDVANSKLGPEEHYLRFGAKEQRDPSTRFSTKGYLKTYKDVATSGMNPLVHYLSFGRGEGRQPQPK